MKTKVAMAISLAGVLAAGTAAALVNTKVLNGGSSSASLTVKSTDQQAVLDAAPSVPSSPVSSVIDQVDPSQQPASSPTQAVYSIGDAGTVTLETANDVLTVVSATPSPGWVVTQSESDETRVEVKFQSGSTEVEFQANLLYGVVNTSVESHDVSDTPPGSVADDHSGRPAGDDHGGGDDDD